MFSLESPHRGDSNEYTQYTIFNIKRKNTLNYLKSAVIGFSQGLKNEFEKTVVNEPSVFEPLKFYCISYFIYISTPVTSNHSISRNIFSGMSPVRCRAARVAQSVRHLTHRSEVLCSIPGLATLFRFSFR